jgi:seryl-tRNA synthetase
MLDILLFREKPELIRESQRRRFPITEKSTDEEKKASAEAVNQVDLVIKLDKQWKDKGTELNVVNKHSNIVDKVSGLKRKQGEKEGEDSTPLFPEEFKDVSKITDEALQPLNVKQLKHLKVYLSKLTENLKKEEKEAEIARDAVLLTIGNLVMDEVPIADDEVFNKEIKVWGTVKPKQEGEWTRRSHYDIMPMLGGVEYEHGAQIAGDRGYFLKGDLVLLHMAVAHFAMKFLVSKKYCPIFPPFFMNKTVMSEVAQLSQFDEELYKVSGDSEEKYLIATSEQPIAALHRGDRIAIEELPKRYAGFSTCFRKEAGSHGRDTLGIFRVHQFDKIEQFCVTSPKVNEKTNKLESETMFAEMIENCEEFYQQLELPYHIVSIVSGKLNNAAAVKYDLEAWFPHSAQYRELVSCSNCTSYQSRRLDVKYGLISHKNQGEKAEYVHMLNCTMCATTRTLCCIVENHQTKDGVEIPKVLQPFMGKTFMPYVNKPPTASTSSTSNKSEKKSKNTVATEKDTAEEKKI